MKSLFLILSSLFLSLPLSLSTRTIEIETSRHDDLNNPSETITTYEAITSPNTIIRRRFTRTHIRPSQSFTQQIPATNDEDENEFIQLPASTDSIEDEELNFDDDAVDDSADTDSMDGHHNPFHELKKGIKHQLEHELHPHGVHHPPYYHQGYSIRNAPVYGAYARPDYPPPYYGPQPYPVYYGEPRHDGLKNFAEGVAGGIAGGLIADGIEHGVEEIKDSFDFDPDANVDFNF